MDVKTEPLFGGRCEPLFADVERQFLANLTAAEGAEQGASLAVYHEGRLVVDLWGGYRDASRHQAWQRDTPVCVFSCTKGVVAIIAMRLVHAGLLDYEEKVATYWPEFGCRGKEGTSVGQLLSHRAGLPRLTTELGAGEIWNWSAVTGALAASAPKWPVGERHGYHALTWGYLVGSVLERAAGLPLRRLLQRDICTPLGVNFSFGLPAERAQQAASLVHPAGVAPEPVSESALESMTRLDEAALLVPAVANSEHWRAALIPGANGHCTALDLATIYQRLIEPDSDFVARDVVAQATALQVCGRDAVLGVESAYALGLQLPTADVTPGSGDSDSCWGHKGIYGATGFVDPDRKLAVGYVMNCCGDPQGDARARRLLAAVYRSLR